MSSDRSVVAEGDHPKPVGGVGAPNMENSQEEVVYGNDTPETTHEGSASSQDVMSEKVEKLARDIYAEFERMMEKYDQDVVKDLMPLVVTVLENLDLAGIENQEHQVELELVKEDHEQLVTQYEREKCHRKRAEQKLLELEFAGEEERNDLISKVESLESIVRMLELKAKNSSDHAARLEDKEAEMKKEYAKLHDRYTDLFKTHFDYVEKTKILFGASQNAKQNQSNELATRRLAEASAGIRLPEELHLRGWKLDQFSPDRDLSMSEALSSQPETTMVEPIQDKTRVRRPNTLYQECKFAEDINKDEKQKNCKGLNDADNAGTDEDSLDAAAGAVVDPAEFASSVSDNIFGMGKEVENIILENIELLTTKNALNIVKDDLIARVDELTSEKDVAEQRLKHAEAQRDLAKERVDVLEAEIKKLKEEAERIALEREHEDTAVPMAQRKRFTRVEMARVLMERNQYKEKLMELQDAVRWSETLKATKLTEGHAFDKPQSTTSGGIFKFFSNLFTSDKSNKGVLSGAISTPSTVSDRETRAATRASLQNVKLRDGISERKAKERRDQLKKVKAHVTKDDIGRVHAYGWSLPTACGQAPVQSVPVPVFCRPLDQNDPNPRLKVWCASGVHLPHSAVAREQMQQQKQPQNHDLPSAELAEMALSSLVWICSGVQNRFSQVSVIDANNPAEVLHTFKIGTSLILCIQSVPGAMDNDFVCDEAYLAECVRVARTADTNQEGNGIITKAEPGLNAVSELIQEHLQSQKDGLMEAGVVAAESSVDPANVVDSANRTSGEKAAHLAVTTSSSQDRDGNASSEKMSTQLPTMWMGTQNGYLYVHSSKADWSTCILTVRLSDGVLAIVHYRGRVFCSLANGRLAVFHRDPVTREFCATRYREIIVSPAPDVHALHCAAVVLDSAIWCGYRNTMAVLDVETLEPITRFSVHPRRESQVRRMATCGHGVWITIRLDSTFRLYHARTYQHLQDVDIEPMISRMIGTGKLGFSFVRITCIGITCNRLWIGTGNGVILSLPLYPPSSSITSDNGIVTNSSSAIGVSYDISETATAESARSSGSRLPVFSALSDDSSTTTDKPSSSSVISGPSSNLIESLTLNNPTEASQIPAAKSFNNILAASLNPGVDPVHSATTPDSDQEPRLHLQSQQHSMSRRVGPLPGTCVRVMNPDQTTPGGGSSSFYCNVTQAQLSFHGHKDSVRFILGVPGTGGMISTTSPAAAGQQPGGTTPPARCMLVLSGGEGYVDLRIGDEITSGDTPSDKSDLSHLIVWEVAL